MDLRSLVNLRRNRYSTNLDKFSKIRDSIFGVLYVLLKENEGPIALHIVLTFIEFLEFMIFPFHYAVADAWQAPTVQLTMYNIFTKFNLVHPLEGGSATLYLIVLYLAVVAVTLVIFNIAYVSYSFSRKYFTVTWPLYVLRTVAKIFVTILFMPIFEIFLTTMHCVKYGDVVATHIGHIKCFYGFHFLHIFCAIVVSIVFVLICLICALTFFECSNEEEDLTAKENSRADFVMLLSKIISIMIITFMATKEYQWVLILSLFSLSVFQFFKFYIEKPYYNRHIQLLMIILNGAYMWTNFNLLIAQIFKSSGFTGAIYIWICGLPVFIAVVILTSDDRLKVLSTKVNEFKKGEEVQRYIRYFLEMVNKRGKERSVDIHLKGFVYNHEENCTISDCPLKKFKKILDKTNHKETKENDGHENTHTAINTTHNQHHTGSTSSSGHGHHHSKYRLK